MAIFLVRNRTSGTLAIPPPVAKTIAAGSTLTVDLPASQMDDAALKILVTKGLISIAAYEDPTASDSIEILPSATLANPDSALASALTATTSLAIRYLAVTGSDTTGDGSRANPWRQPQRAVEAVPHGRCAGTLEIRCLDAGPYIGVVKLPRDLTSKEGLTLNINFVGAGTSILDIPVIPAGSTIANATGGNKLAVLRYAVGAHAALTDGSHWLKCKTTNGSDYTTTAYVIDGTRSVSPNLDVAYGFSLSFFGYTAGAEVVPYTTLFSQPTANNFVVICGHEGGQEGITGGVALTLTGIILGGESGANGWLAAGRVALNGCKSGGTFNCAFNSQNGVVNMWSANQIRVTAPGAGSSVLGGIYKKEMVVLAGRLFLSGIMRSSASPMVEVGGVTTTDAISGAALETLGVDFEGTGTQQAIYVNQGRVKISSSGGCTVESIATFLKAENYSQVRDVGGVFGSVTGIPVTLDNYSQGIGFGSEGGATRLRNSTSAGSDIVIGAKAVTSFALLPATDLAEGSPRLCRSS